MELEELLSLFDAVTDVSEVSSLKDTTGNFVSGITEGANAKIRELESSVEELQRKYDETAARNYELMISATRAEEGENREEEIEDDAADRTIDDILEDE